MAALPDAFERHDVTEEDMETAIRVLDAIKEWEEEHDAPDIGITVLESAESRVRGTKSGLFGGDA